MELRLPCEAVQHSVIGRAPDRRFGRIDPRDLRGAATRSIQGESPVVAEAIQDPPFLRIATDRLPVFPLIQKLTGLLPLEQFDGIFQTVFGHSYRTQRPAQDSLSLLQPLERAERNIIAFDNRPWMKKGFQNVADQRQALIHPE